TSRTLLPYTTLFRSTVGGFVRMNGGAYGREVADILVDCEVILPGGQLARLTREQLQYSYRHSALPDGAIVVSARFKGHPGDPARSEEHTSELQSREN